MIASIALLALATASQAARLDPATHRQLLLNGRPQIGLWKALSAQLDAAHDVQKPFSAPQQPLYEPHCFDQRISHFESDVNGTFCQRFWVDGTYYKKGGPVFLLDGGETSGEDRLPFMKTGILEILSQATGGLSIVLEHRYYGKSVPVPSFSTDDLRFLNNAEALEDSAEFMRHFKAPASLNITDDLHPTKTPWIYYGGSYAGARAAHMRTQYPEIVWGAIASSAVTHAQINFFEYYDPIQKYADESCITALQTAVGTIDALLDLSEPIPSLVKGLFGLQELSDEDFADVIASPLGYWQAQNWNPAVSSTGFNEFCSALTTGKGGSTIGIIKIPAVIMNYAKYIKETVVADCPTDVVDCFGSDDPEKFQGTELTQIWRLWLFQVCTQWGYFMPAPPEDRPSIVSRRLTLDHTHKICRYAYPPGKHFWVPEWPDVAEVNKRGDYGIEAHRLAFVDGDRDPWRPMTPQSAVAPRRNSTVDKPVHLIYDAIHHYDEDQNGLKDHSKEPARIRDIHEFEVLFVQEWISQWKEKKLAEDK